MIDAIRKIVVNILTVVNLVMVGLLLFSGYSDHIQPIGHEWIACAGMLLPLAAVANLLFIPLWIFIAWRRLWIPLAGLALAYVPIRIYMPLHGHTEVPDGALTIMSWNVHNYSGNGGQEENVMDSIFNYLRQQQPDILCLQEASPRKKTKEEYAKMFLYNEVDTVSKKVASNTNVQSLHTRFPVLRKERVEYESESNGSMAYFLLIDGDTVIVINNHLEVTHLSTNDRARYKTMLHGNMERDTAKAETLFLVKRIGQSMATRARQADAIHQYVETHRRYPIILCGDFNDTPISYARRTIAKGLTDCFVEAGNGLGISFNQKGFNFRIDHLMVSKHFTPYTCKIDVKISLSDHYPLTCRLKMADKP